MLRVAWVVSVAAALATLVLDEAAAAPLKRGDSRPNVVYILLDDAGYGDFGATGSPYVATPGFDRLCREGTRFTHHYNGSALCGDARCTLLTGFDMGRRLHGAPSAGAGLRENPCSHGWTTLRDEDVTIAEALSHVGYATCGVGYWTLGDAGSAGAPELQGFDRWYGFLGAERAHQHYAEWLWDGGRRVELRRNREGGRELYVPNLLEREALRFIRENSDRPFFLFLACTLPHAPYEIPERDPAALAYRDKPWPPEVRNYAAMLSRADRTATNILELLDELDLTDQTLVFYTADNGADPQIAATLASDSGLRGGRGDLYEGGIRTPMAVRWPGRIAPGATSDRPWSTADVLPTLCKLAGAAVPAGLSGVDVTATLMQEAAPPHPPMYWELVDPPQQAVRWGRWKGICRGDADAIEVYDLQEDPSETRDLASERPREARLLREAIAQARAEIGD
ncbi:MAG: sulfatase-like hydrolase/transferase [Pirellulales bacterium]|nr:sulfatase-like hydrolase/transferase [Pirellulales bacterium]